jgi:hypothetical protein
MARVWKQVRARRPGARAAQVLVAGALGALFTVSVAPDVHADEGPLQMSPDKPMRCLADGKGLMWRVQCDAASKVCIYAPDAELDAEGTRLRPLERMSYCDETGPFDQEKLKADGFRLEQGLLPAPYGWYRDRLGKVFQYNFDLHRRMFLGGGWVPELRGGEQNTRRSMIEFGLFEWQYYDANDRNPTRHRLRLVEGEIRLAPFWATGFLLRYDLSIKRRDPLVRISTFFGEPRRYDIRSRMGLFMEAVGLEVRDTAQGNATLWKYGTADITFDLWQSSNLYSYARVRGGGLVERLTIEKQPDQARTSFTPNAALDLDFTLDSNGFHHLTGLASIETPQTIDPSAGQPVAATRLRGELGYEVIAFALNDQPISLRLATSANRRDDIPGFPSGWIYSATAGLRFSLWAPARDP